MAMQYITAREGSEPVALDVGTIERFGLRFRGAILVPQDSDYDEVRKVWNGMVDKRPAIIVRCATASDVIEAVNLARDKDLLVSVRGGGHNIAGNCLCDGGMTIDLSPLKEISVDPDRRTARAGAGVWLGELDAATQAHGLATTMGLASDTGIAGLTLGGGVGRLGRKHGLACDNLLSAEVVLADGRLVRASAEENADLFWGLCGGGGNLGVVTTFEYRLHPLGPTVLGGLVLWDWSRAREALRHYAAFSISAPDEVDALGVLLTSPDGDRMFAVSVCYAGAIGEAESALRQLRELGPAPAQDLIAPIAYTALQSSADAIFPRGRRYYWKSHFMPDLSGAATDTMIDLFARVPSPMSVAALQQVGGAIARVPTNATAYGNRDAAYDCIPISIWEDPAQDERNIAWGQEFWEAMRPFATGGVYVNNLGDEGEERIRAAFGVNHERLAGLKAKYVPSNLFRLNQNVRPTA